MSHGTPRSWPDVPGYEIVRVIGRGGFGTVYEARQLSVDRTIALKVLDARTLGDDGQRRFRAEARTIGGLSWHRHVASLYDAGTTPDGDPYLVMELLDGGSLRGRTLSPPALTEVAHQISSALGAAHDAGVLHRDIKPDNILVDRQGTYVLSDFGIATLDDATRSRSGSFVGTYAYCAPELLDGQWATVRSDLYSLGATLHALATGRAPFAREDSSPAALIRRVIEEPMPPLPDTIPDALQHLIVQLMSKDPVQRPASADEVRSMAEGSGSAEATDTARTSATPIDPRAPLTAGPTHGEPPARPPAKQPRGHRPGLAAIGVLAAVLVLATAWAVQRTRSGSPTTGSAHLPSDPAGPSVQGTIWVGDEPSAITVVEGVPWVSLTGDRGVASIDPTTRTVSDLLDVGASPRAIAATASALWVTDAASAQVLRIDLATSTIRRTTIAGGSPQGMAVSDGAIWVADQAADGITEISAENGNEVSMVPVGNEPWAVAAAIDGSLWVVNRGDRTVTRVDVSSRTATMTTRVGADPWEIAVGGGGVWVTDASSNSVVRLDPSTGQILITLHVGTTPSAIAVDDRAVWVTNRDDDTVVRIDPNTNRVTDTLPVGHQPAAVAVTDGDVWVVNRGDGTVTHIAG